MHITSSFKNPFNFFIKFFSSSTLFVLKLAPYQPEQRFRLNSLSLGINSSDFFGNLPPDSIPINPALLASDRPVSYTHLTLPTNREV